MLTIKRIVDFNAIVKKATEGLEASRLELLKTDLTNARREELVGDILFFAQKGSAAARMASVEVRALGKKVTDWMK